MTLEAKLRAAALATPALTALLGTSPFRWQDTQLIQGSTLPAVTVLLIDTVNQYSNTARLSTALSRVQFTVFDTDPERARSVEAAIVAFLDSFNAMNTSVVSPQQANWVVSRRQQAVVATDPMTFQRMLDAMIFNNELI